jgi:uncharacterized membrane protein SirB2
MTTQNLFHAIQTSEIATDIGNLDHLFGALAQLIHIAGLILLLSAILLVNLRLLGLGLKNQPITRLVKATNPLIQYGFGLLFISGIFVFLPSADLYYPNPAFWAKFAVLAVAIVVQFSLYRYVTATDYPNKILAYVTAFISLTLWFGVGFIGRAIGFF